MEWIRKQKTEALRERTVADVPFLTFPIPDDTGLVIDGFSARLDGVSEGKFAAMNSTFTRGDNPVHVTENYRRMAGALGAEMERMALSYQTHTTDMKVVTEEDAGKGTVKERDYTDVNGMITNVPGITLVTFYADCVPLYLLDTARKVIDLSHPGWRGTINRVRKTTMEAMAREYGSRPENMIAYIGPNVYQDCYEAGGEMAQNFREAFEVKYWPEPLEEGAGGKYQLNLWWASETIFLEADIWSEHIQATDICTHCNPELLFSHRTCGDERGNLAAFLYLKQQLKIVSIH